MCYCWSVCVIAVAYVLLLERMCYCWSVCVIAGAYVLLLERTCYCWSVCVIAGAYVTFSLVSSSGFSLTLEPGSTG